MADSWKSGDFWISYQVFHPSIRAGRQYIHTACVTTYGASTCICGFKDIGDINGVYIYIYSRIDLVREE
jgi:hypothetical protein